MEEFYEKGFDYDSLTLDETDWNFIDDYKPDENKRYVVAWSNPYEKEMTIGVAYWNTDRFSGNPAGANEILFWFDPNIIKIDVGKELRHRRVKK